MMGGEKEKETEQPRAEDSSRLLGRAGQTGKSLEGTGDTSLIRVKAPQQRCCQGTQTVGTVKAWGRAAPEHQGWVI